MENRKPVFTLRVSRARTLGIVLAVIGILLLVLAWSIQSDIDKIGTTNDLLLQHKISMLEDQRNAYLVTGIGILFLGLFAIALLSEPSVSTIVAESEMISAAKTANDTIVGLSLTGNSSYLPARNGLTKQRVFIVATNKPIVPPKALSDDMIMSPGKDGSSPGMLVEPFGARLLESVESELNTKLDGVGLEAAEGTLQILKHGFGIMKDFHFKERDGNTILRVEYSGLRDACRTVRKERPDTCRQLQCFGCSCLLLAAARATGKLVSIKTVDNSKDVVEFTLNIEEW
jgi:hypothetical protein